MAQAVVWGKCPFQFPDIKRPFLFYCGLIWSSSYCTRKCTCNIWSPLKFQQIFLASAFQTHTGPCR